jgi:hypothetical protein
MKHIIKKIQLILLLITIGNTNAQTDKSDFIEKEKNSLLKTIIKQYKANG